MTNLIDIHTHSIASGHGSQSTISDMAKMAAFNGIRLLGISDHGPATYGSCKSSYFQSLAVAPKIRFGIELLYGVELNILNSKGEVDLPQNIISQLDYTIISMHTQNYKPSSIYENTNAYIEAMKHSKVSLIGHCDDEKYPLDYLALVQAAHEFGVLIELNNISLSPDGYRGDTLDNDTMLLKYCRQYKHPIILSSDSHGVNHIGDIIYAKALINSILFPSELILNDKISTFKSFLALK